MLKNTKHLIHYKVKHWYLYLRYFERLRDFYQSFIPYAIDEEKINNSFLKHTVEKNYVLQQVPKKIYVIWSGENNLSESRLKAIDAIGKDISEFEIITVTPKNLCNFIRPDRPLHPLYETLSFVHRSDYLRAYLLWAHGGGYTDIKKPKSNWEAAYSDFAKSKSWISGYPEIVYKMIPECAPFGKDLKKVSSKMIGQGAFLARPGNPFLEEWLDEMDRRIDLHAEALKKNPGNAYGTNPGYPLQWTELLAEIIHPLCVKYSEKVMRDKRLLFEYKGIGHR